MTTPRDPKSIPVLVASAHGERRRDWAAELAAAGHPVAQATSVRECQDGLPKVAVAVVDSGLGPGGSATLAPLLRVAPGRPMPELVLVLRATDAEFLLDPASSELGELLVEPAPPGLLARLVARAAAVAALRAAAPVAFAAGPAPADDVATDRSLFLATVAEKLASPADPRPAFLAVSFRVAGATEGNGAGASVDPGLLESAVAGAIHFAAAETPGRPEVRCLRLETGKLGVFASWAAGPGDATAFATRIVERVTQSVRVRGERVSCVTAVGVARAEDAIGADALLQRAETANYCAHYQARCPVQEYTDSMSRWAPERQMLERGLRDAVANGELVVHYQPRVNTATRRVLGFEALVRWQHPTLGMIAPGQFIPMAEETGLIVPIGEWVLRTACAQAKAWQDRGHRPVQMAVNLSAVQFRTPELFQVVTRALADTGLAPDRLELELTESMLMTDPRSTIATLKRLKSAGIQLAIDDFGTGYSSLSYLKKFPIDALKVDQSFVREVTTNPEDAAITTAIILLGHSLKLNVIAEGVETESQLSFLRVLQCNELQGFLISRPVEASRAEAFLAQPAPAPASACRRTRLGPGMGSDPFSLLSLTRRARAAREGEERKGV